MLVPVCSQQLAATCRWITSHPTPFHHLELPKFDEGTVDLVIHGSHDTCKICSHQSSLITFPPTSVAPARCEVSWTLTPFISCLHHKRSQPPLPSDPVRACAMGDSAETPLQPTLPLARPAGRVALLDDVRGMVAPMVPGAEALAPSQLATATRRLASDPLPSVGSSGAYRPFGSLPPPGPAATCQRHLWNGERVPATPQSDEYFPPGSVPPQPFQPPPLSICRPKRASPPFDGLPPPAGNQFRTNQDGCVVRMRVMVT